MAPTSFWNQRKKQTLHFPLVQAVATLKKNESRMKNKFAPRPIFQNMKGRGYLKFEKKCKQDRTESEFTSLMVFLWNESLKINMGLLSLGWESKGSYNKQTTARRIRLEETKKEGAGCHISQSCFTKS